MQAKICDICKERDATVTVSYVEGGQRRTLHLCPDDYRRLKRGEEPSPLKQLFSGPFDDVFGDFWDTDDFPGFSSRMGYPLPRHREGVDVSNYFSEHTKEIIQRAASIAVEWGRKELDTEHLLYALTESEVIEELCRQFKIKVDDVRGYLEANSPHGKREKPSSSKEEPVDLTISPRIKNVFELAWRASQDLGHSYIGPEHLFVGLVQEEDGIAGVLLRKYGLTPESVRQKIVKVVGRGAKEGRVERQSNTPELDKYSRDLTVLAKEGRLDPVIGRGDEIESAVEILSRRTKNNPVLIGEPGVGKTAIVEGLAQRIAAGDVPEVLEGKRVVELNLNALVAGSKYRGEFEERIKKVIDEVVSHKDEIILFIDELHTLMRAGGTGEEGGLDASQVIKPYLARGEMHLIGATTLNEYQKHIEKDAALERRFQPIFVSEPTIEQAIEILRGLRDRYEAHHKVKIKDEAIIAAVELSDRYIPNRFLPDKAIDLLDQAASRVRIGLTSRPDQVREIERSLEKLRRERDSARAHKKTEELKKIEKEIAEHEKKIEEYLEKWRKEKGITTAEVGKEHIAAVVSRLTGIPVRELTEEEKEKLLKMEERIRERIVGQEEAVRAVSDAVRRARAGLAPGRRPIASFLFLGPTGVGKTELAKSLAWIVFGDEDALVRIDMSEYMERHAVSRLIGAPPGYVGYEEGGQLTEAVRRRPYQVILLDEIEKAHHDVYNILLQVFDEGRLTDGKGRVVDFTNTIIIATSNLGSEVIQRRMHEKKASSYKEMKEELMGILRAHFRPEFLNRIDDIIVFHTLTENEVKDIVRIQLERVARLAHGQGISLTFDDSVVNKIAKEGYVPEFGAREIKRKIQSEIEVALAREMLEGKIKEGDTIRVRVSSKEDTVVFEKIAPQKKLKKS